jgi:hypothetical protein
MENQKAGWLYFLTETSVVNVVPLGGVRMSRGAICEPCVQCRAHRKSIAGCRPLEGNKVMCGICVGGKSIAFRTPE